MADDNKISFPELKEKVGINDVAFSLGYQLNRKAGVGKYYELVLGPVNNPIDTIIIRKTESKSQQTFFRRNGSKGDVITLIKENLNSFNVEGKNDWLKVANVLRQFANMPPVVLTPDLKAVEEAKTSTKFNPDRYEISPVKTEPIHWLLAKRGFNKEAVADMGDSITLIKDKNQTNFNGYNIGFPYRNPETNEITGYEIRGGNGFKSKAAGTDSSNSFWCAEFGSKNGNSARNVYLFESSFDAMAFYQKNKTKLMMSPFALVSMGGSFTQNQIEGIVKKFPRAKLWDCFDNDLAGHNFAKNLVVYVDKIPLDIQYKQNNEGDKLAILTKGTESVTKKADNFNFQEAAKELGVTYSIGHWKAPNNYKDWNDYLLDKKIEYVPAITKRDRDNNLAESRKNKTSFSY